MLPINEAPLGNLHTHNSEVHYRLYMHEAPDIICVQDFDYPDYDASRFLTEEAFETELAAQEALRDLLVEAYHEADEAEHPLLEVLISSGAGLNRRQALHHHVLSATRVQ